MKEKIVPIYVETEPNALWEVHADTPNGTLLGFIQHITYVFPMNLFIPKGEYWFVPKYEQAKMTIGKTKEKAFKKFLDLYCNAEVKE